MKPISVVVVAVVFAAAVAGCGSSSSSSAAPDVSGAPASDQATLFKAANLNKVLAQVQAHLPAGAQLTTLKIEPRDVKAVATSAIVTVDSAGHALTVTTPAIGGGQTLPLSAVKANVVQQVAQKAANASHGTLADVAYVATIPFVGRGSLGVYMTDHAIYYLANLNGSNFHKAGGGSAGTTSGAAATGAGTSSTGTSSSGGAAAGGTTINPQQIATCIQNAGTDVSKIKACTGH